MTSKAEQLRVMERRLNPSKKVRLTAGVRNAAKATAVQSAIRKIRENQTGR